MAVRNYVMRLVREPESTDTKSLSPSLTNYFTKMESLFLLKGPDLTPMDITYADETDY